MTYAAILKSGVSGKYLMAMRSPFSDDFERADEALGDSANWEVTAIDASGAINIVSGDAVLSSEKVMGRWVGNTVNSNHYSQGPLSVVADGAVRGVLGVRLQDGGAGGYCLATRAEDRIHIMRLNGDGTADTLGIQAGLTLNGLTGRLEADGDTIRAKVDGTTVLSVTDATHTGGRTGLAQFGDGQGTLASWQGGNL